MQRDNNQKQKKSIQKDQVHRQPQHNLPEAAQMQFTTEGLPPIIAKKIGGLVGLLNQSTIDCQALKKHLAEGIPDEAAIIREYCWKIILGYLPEDKSKWESTITSQTQFYHDLVKMFLPPEKFPEYPLILKKDHPRFGELQNDYLLWEQIEKDTSRTHAEFSFFAMQSAEIMMPYLTNARRQKFRLINGQDEYSYKQFVANKQIQRKTYRYDYMTRILYIYSKINPKIQYVQGMNEILAPIFYLVNVTKPANAIQQASCFFMFNNSICDIIELHIKDFDKSKNGIYGKLNEVNQMLMVIEPVIWKRMEDLKIDPFFYCFRWVTLLYAQDFALFDTLRIWESIFSSDNRMQFIKFFAIAIMIGCKEVIESSDFTDVLQYLQNIKENTNINKAIEIANALYIKYYDYDFNQLAQKGKKQIQKQKQKQNEKKQKDKEKQQKIKQKQQERLKRKEQKNKQKELKHKLKQQKKSIYPQHDPVIPQQELKKKQSTQSQKQQKQKQKLKQKQIQKLKDDQKQEKQKPKKIEGLFKKFGNMVDKFLN